MSWVEEFATPGNGGIREQEVGSVSHREMTPDAKAKMWGDEFEQIYPQQQVGT